MGEEGRRGGSGRTGIIGGKSTFMPSGTESRCQSMTGRALREVRGGQRSGPTDADFSEVRLLRAGPA